MAVLSKRIHATQIPDRPPRKWAQTANAIAYFIVFNLGCLMINTSQFVVLLPLRCLPFALARSLYDSGIRLSKGAFGTLLSKSLSPRRVRPSLSPCLVLMCQWFAPSRLVITFEQDGLGAFSMDEIDAIAMRDRDGRVLGLNLPTKSVLIANHQVCTQANAAMIPILPLPGVCRLVVCVVLDLLYGHSPRRVHRVEEESQVGSHHRLGTPFSSSLRALQLIDLGHAILQLHLPCPFLGFRSCLSRQAASSPWSKSSAP